MNVVRQAYSKHRALARLARHRDVATHHAAEIPADGEGQGPYRLKNSFVSRSNYFKCFANVSTNRCESR